MFELDNVNDVRCRRSFWCCHRFSFVLSSNLFASYFIPTTNVKISRSWGWYSSLTCLVTSLRYSFFESMLKVKFICHQTEDFGYRNQSIFIILSIMGEDCVIWTNGSHFVIFKILLVYKSFRTNAIVFTMLIIFDLPTYDLRNGRHKFGLWP